MRFETVAVIVVCLFPVNKKFNYFHLTLVAKKKKKSYCDPADDDEDPIKAT